MYFTIIFVAYKILRILDGIKMKRVFQSGSEKRKKAKRQEEVIAKTPSIATFMTSKPSTSQSSEDQPDFVVTAVVSEEAETEVTTAVTSSAENEERVAATCDIQPPEPSPTPYLVQPMQLPEEHKLPASVNAVPAIDQVQLDLTDIGNWPRIISDGLRMHLVQQGSEIVQHKDGPFATKERRGVSAKGSVRRLEKDWFYRKLKNNENILRTWLCYSPKKEALYCFCCLLFAKPGESKSKFVSESGLKRYWELSRLVPKHENGPVHRRAQDAWKELAIRTRLQATIDAETQSQIRTEEHSWREILKRILDVILYLAKQNLAFRGHDESESSSNRGNFLELIKLLARYDPVLREHVVRMDSGSKQVSYLSPGIQNEFIGLVGTHVRTTIIEKVKAAKYFSIIFDSTPDTAHIDQTSQVLRYVSIEGKSVTVNESFIEFVETKGKTAEDIYNLILKKLEDDGLNIMDCRGQGYDNAAVMKGKHTGVQKRILELNPKATYIACSNHSLNLAGVHASKAQANCDTFFGTIDRLYAFFAGSTHRWDVLTEVTGISMKRLSDTRWSSRGDSVQVVAKDFMNILKALENLTATDENSATRSTAASLIEALKSFKFLVYLGFWSPVLVEVVDAQVYLQKKGLNIHDCAQKLKALETLLREQRDDIAKLGIEYAEKMCAELNLPTDPQNRTRTTKLLPGEKRNTSDAPLTYKDLMQNEVRTCIDCVTSEMANRFQQMHEIAERFSFLTPSKLLNREVSINVDLVDSDDADIAEIPRERQRLIHFIEAAQTTVSLKEQGPLELLQFIQQFELADSVPNLVVLLRISLTIAISVATCERSFSKLKLIKNYLRSTMGNERLSSLAIMSIERDTADTVDFEDVINSFAAMKARKISL